MSVVIGEENRKLGKIPTVSFPPILACKVGTPCSKYCYAKFSFAIYPRVKRAWGNNFALWNDKPDEFHNDIRKYLKKRNPARFRYHVGGDIPSQTYIEYMKQTAKMFPATEFLTYTKQYDFDYSRLPDNLVIVLSLWPNIPFVNPCNLPLALVYNPKNYDMRININTSEDDICIGHCQNCWRCWNLRNGDRVIFPIHGQALGPGKRRTKGLDKTDVWNNIVSHRV